MSGIDWPLSTRYNGDELLREKYGAFYEPMDTGFAVHVNMSAVSEDQCKNVAAHCPPVAL